MPLAIYFTIGNFDGYFSKKYLSFSIILSGIIVASIGLAEFIAGENLLGSLYYVGTQKLNVFRTNGPFHDAIGYSAITLIYLSFAYFCLNEKIITKSVFILLFICYTIGCMVTLSRATIIAYLFIVLIIISKNKFKTIFINIYIAILLAVGAYLLWELFSNTALVRERFINLNTVIGRWDQYRECLNIFYDNPFFGIGYGNYKATHAYFIHNSYLKDLVELGILGFLFHSFFILSVIFSNFKKNFLTINTGYLKTRLLLIIIVAIVPNTIDFLNNHHFTFILFAMIAVCNIEIVLNDSAKLSVLKNRIYI